jgi:hypothetical protein
MYNASSLPTVVNSVLWDNGTEEIVNSLSSITISDSVVEGGDPPGCNCTNVFDLDPHLGPMQNNGGFTKTMALEVGSVAVDLGDELACPSKDQRGLGRPQGLGCDLGAFEVRTKTFMSPGEGRLGARIRRSDEAGGGKNARGRPSTSAMTTATTNIAASCRSTHPLPDGAALAAVRVQPAGMFNVNPFTTHGLLLIGAAIHAGNARLSGRFQASADEVFTGMAASRMNGTGIVFWAA